MTQAVREETVEELAAAGWAPGRLIDVRSTEDYATGHVPGAVNVPLDDLLGEPARFGADELHIICQSGRRSLKAVEAVEAVGTPAVSVAGGTSAWIAAGHPIER